MVPAAFTWIDDLERWLGRKVTHHVVNDETLQPAPLATVAHGSPRA